MKIVIFFFAILALMACTSSYKNTQVNPVPDFSFIDKGASNRSPASVFKATERVKMNNKTLYFHTLFAQYKKLGEYFPKLHSPIRSCPSFHSSIESYSNKKPKRTNYQWNTQALKQSAGTKESKLYPELKLKAGEISAEMHILEGKNVEKVMNQAIANHIDQTKAELQRLCDVAHSQNYFIFENFVTYHNQNPGFTKSPKALPALMKTTVFSNMYLIHSLEQHKSTSRAIASVKKSSFEDEILRRLGVNWSENYFQTVSMRKANDLAKYVKP